MRPLAKEISTSAAFHQLSVEETIAALDTGAQHGLNTDEVRRRLDQYGANELRKTAGTPAWRRFLKQFQDALVVLLLIATAVSAVVWYVERDTALPYESLVILAIVILNAILGFVQEEKAEQALSALRELSAPQATVIRDSTKHRIPARELVPGDVLLIEEGDTIPADARLIEVVELQTLEASLTGESLPVEKSVEPVDAAAALADRTDMLFAGTAASYGHGRAVVTQTGMQTELGKIASMLEETEAEVTPLQRELDRTGKRLGIAVVIIAAVVVTTLVLLEGVHDLRRLVDVLLFGVALAVAAVPEGLAAIVTMVLAIGVQRMAKRGAIVRNLPAVETLGSATVIASDKTGTLTRNQMTVRTVMTSSGRVEVGGSGYEPQGEFQGADGALERTELEQLLRAAALDSNATLAPGADGWSVHGDPTEGALIVAARKAGLTRDALDQRFPRIRELAFSSQRRMMSTIHKDREHPGSIVLFVKGAVTEVLERSSREFRNGCAQPLTASRHSEIAEANRVMTGQALRTLAVACRELPPEVDWAAARASGLERDLTLLGIAGMADSPRREVAEAVQLAKTAGVRPIMITGDQPGTALAIARELGIAANERVLTGPELELMQADDLAAAADETSVYARVDPRHKMRIVDALQSHGAIVAMTGDGVNDAPALKSADIGVAMGIAGTDVAKEAADIVLTDDNFATIVAAVEEGRAIFSNIRKFLRYLLSSNVGEVLTIFLGVVFAAPLGLRTEDGLVLPLLAAQVLWINLITDGAPALALGVDPPSAGIMLRPPRPLHEGVITTRMWIDMGIVGIVMAAGTLLVLDASIPGGLIAGATGVRHGRTMAFTTIVLFQLFNAFNARSSDQSAFRGFLANKWLLGAVALSLALQIVAVYVPILQDGFQTTSLDWRDWMLCFLVASSVLWIVEIWKVTLRHPVFKPR
jgi:P-type Ca2+ transporter type 2C